MGKMFKCKECGSTEFQLVVRPEYQQLVEVGSNEHDEVVISMGSEQFVADLMFMNQFAVCSNCGAIKCWQYFFPNRAKVV